MMFVRVCCLLILLVLSACATPKHWNGPPSPRPFEFSRDTFAFPNELVWEYEFDRATGRRSTHRREPKPDYTLHCFVVARSARQFFEQARFEPNLPKADDFAYRRLIRAVVARPTAGPAPESERIVIPGFSDLRAFSAAKAGLLKQECGGAWQSYFQRDNWRMIFPFSRRHQARMAEAFKQALARNRPPVVHVLRFPTLAINHAMLIFGCSESPAAIHFQTYDPNNPGTPTELLFDRATSRFSLPRNNYFVGGRVDVYEIYNNAN